jgi:hypothetical protein
MRVSLPLTRHTRPLQNHSNFTPPHSAQGHRAGESWVRVTTHSPKSRSLDWGVTLFRQDQAQPLLGFIKRQGQLELSIRRFTPRAALKGCP